MNTYAEQAQKLFESYPTVNSFWFTPDGQAFFEKKTAQMHHPDVTEVTRSGPVAAAEATEAAAEPAPHSAAPQDKLKRKK